MFHFDQIQTDLVFLRFNQNQLKDEENIENRTDQC